MGAVPTPPSDYTEPSWTSLPKITAINPIKALYWSAVLNGVVAVPVMFVMMKIVCRPDIMGKFAARGWLRALGWLATAVMLVISAAMLVTSI